MFKKLAIASVTATLAFSAHAVTATGVQETVELTDGATLYIFTDGKTGMADRYGRPTLIPEGRALETIDGRPIELNGNEVARVTAVVLQAFSPGS